MVVHYEDCSTKARKEIQGQFPVPISFLLPKNLLVEVESDAALSLLEFTTTFAQTS